jgi:excisionase family DNA binding protein
MTAIEAPPKCTVYQLYNERQDVLYVGITTDVAARLKQHADKPWWSSVASVGCREYDSRELAADAETDLIRKLRPRHNRSQNPSHYSPEKAKLPPIYSLDGSPVVVPAEKNPTPRRVETKRFDAFNTRRRYVTMAEAADYLAVTTRTVRQMVADGRLTGYRSGSRLVRLDLNEIDAAMKPFGGSAAL